MSTDESIGIGNRGADRLWLAMDRKWWTLAVVGSGTFMTALDMSIVNVALPAIGHGTGAALDTLEWVVLAYLLALTGTLLVFGRIADVHGKRRIYMAGQVLFALGSLLCGVSGHIATLVASRALQGLGGSMILALSPAVLIGAFPAEERGRALGLQATMTYLGLSIGPALGGWLTEHLGWPAIFLVNVPIGLAMVTLSSQVLAREARPPRGSTPPFDVAGAGLMAAALSALLFAMSHGQRLGWSHPLIAGLLTASGAGWAAFVIVERRTEHPVLDVRLFSSWTLSASTLAAFLCYCCMAAVNLTAPFLLIRACGLSESRAGLGLMATPLAMLAFTAPAGHLSDRVGVRIPATAGMIAFGVGALLMVGVSPGDGVRAFLPGAIALGVGAGLFTAPNNSAIMGAAPQERRGVAGAVLTAARTSGFACGTAFAGAIYAARVGAPSTSAPAAVAAAVHACLWAVAAVAVVGAVLSALRNA
jgi:EmrB/QacA subfamily drug resistance transporter